MPIITAQLLYVINLNIITDENASGRWYNQSESCGREGVKSMYIAGLILTLVGWLFQGYETVIRKTHRINIVLPVTYFAACILFGINSFQADEILFGVIDIVIAAIIALVIFIYISKR